MNQLGRSYPSDLTNQQWDVIKDLIPPARRGGRKRTADVRKVLDAVFYLNRTGCGWRYLPENFPPWRTVYEYFSKWRSTRVLEVICEELSKIARKQSGKEEIPSVLIIDSQSAKAQFGESRGYDGFKKVRGRKRHIIVDTLGIVHGIRISPANVGDVNEGIELLRARKPFLDQRGLRAIYADGGYRHKFADAMVETFRTKPIIIQGSTTLVGSTKPNARGAKREKVLRTNLKPTRWIVERTFAWFNHYRRLSRDFERTTASSEAMIHLAMTQILLRKMHPI